MTLRSALNTAVVLFSILSAAAPVAENITPSMKAKTVVLAIGMNRLTGSHEITAAPPALLGKPAILCDRGDGTKSSPPWSFSVSSPARVYLSVLRRGETVIPAEWVKTGATLQWKSKDGSAFVDDLYSRLVAPGEVRVPGHDGVLGASRGVPHLVIFDDPDARVISGAPSDPGIVVKAAPESIWVEAEDFRVQGGWTLEGDGKARYLQGGINKEPKEDATCAQTVIQAAYPGCYRLWVRSKDSAQNQPATRFFTLEVAGHRSEVNFGTHREEGWAWQAGGEFDLPSGEVLVRLLDTSDFFARCDRLLLTTDLAYTPKGAGGPANARHKNLDFKAKTVVDNSGLVFDPAPAGKEVARMVAGDFTLSFESFQRGKDTMIAPAIFAKAGRRISPAQWQYFVWLGTPESNASYNARTSHAPYFTIRGSLEVGGGKREGQVSVQNPFLSAKVKRYFYGNEVVSANPGKVVLRAEAPEFTALMTYSVRDGFPQVDVVATPKADGFAMIGAYAFSPQAKADTSFFLLPYHWQAKRWPDSVLLMPSATATAPLSLMEGKSGSETWSFAIAGDIRGEKMAWPSYENSTFALAIQNEREWAQPGIFAPVPATKGHSVKAGKPIELHFGLYGAPKAWNGAFDEVVTGYFGVKDIRRNWQGTLHDAALNMFDLVMNDHASGWVPRHMGFSQIENKNTVSQSTLLMALEQYWLTGDEAVWDKRALPTAAFLFSRGSQHFATHPTDFGLTYVPKVDFDGPVKLYGTSTFQGMHEQFRRRAPVFLHDALKSDGGAKLNNGYNSIPEWSETLYAYRLTGDKKYLEAAVAGARAYVASNITTPPSNPRGYQPFVKLTQPPYFWALVDLYEETKEPAFLEAAKIAADYVLTTLFIHPYPFKETYDVTRQEAIDFSRPTAWWNLDRFFRLGFQVDNGKADHPPTLEIGSLSRRTDIREETVPAWVVSPLGVSIEQPSTMARSRVMAGKSATETPMYAIRQNCEVAYLMRLWGLTGEKRYWTYARNGILGQFNNYPGYYINLMSTTERTAEYPIKGPDLSDIYYHHIPVHLAFTVDFLFTSAEMRSGGRVKFPSVLQQGYVWFINRMVGHRPGEFYGVKQAQPLLRRDLFTLDGIAANVVTAASPDTFCMLVMNEEETNVVVNVALSPKTLDIGSGAVTLVADNGPARSVALKGSSISVPVSAKGITALLAPGTRLKDRTLFLPEAPAVAQGKSSFIRESDGALGARVQAALFAHPLRDRYDAFINTDMKDGALAISTSTDGKTWNDMVIESFPYEGFVRVEKTGTPLQFKLTRTDASGGKHVSPIRTLSF